MSFSSHPGLQRDKSYRKPVPVFVPSPPPSPRPTSPAPGERSLQSFESVMNKEMPPLPLGWRDAIHKARSTEKRPVVESVVIATPLSEAVTISRASSVYGSVSAGELGSSPSMSQAYLSDTYSVSEYSVSDYGEQVPVSTLAIAPMPATPSPHSARRRTLPKLEYRPPTPPLAVHGKRGRTVSDEGADMDFDTNLPGSLAVPRAIPRIKRHAPERAATEPATPGAQTAGEAASQNAAAGMPPSPIALENRETWLRDTWYILPVLPACGAEEPEEPGSYPSKFEIQAPEVSHQTRSGGFKFWGRIGMLGHMLKSKLKHIGPVPSHAAF
ncbi:hypothetical protein HWV62_3578 [Athelia sp. TMB]|nr:hypothetical protein HWV62_3578 [Athelia sp. TMB]